MRNLRYDIDDNDSFAIRVWDLDNPNENDAPFMLQPDWPNGTAWSSHDEADTWAKQLIAMMNDPKVGRPGNSPEEPFIEWVEPETTTPTIITRNNI